jgi:hypothetical protein
VSAVDVMSEFKHRGLTLMMFSLPGAVTHALTVGLLV